MKKINKIIYTILISAPILVGCDDYLDINTNTDAISKAPAELILPVVTFYASQTNYDHAEYNM